MEFDSRLEDDTESSPDSTESTSEPSPSSSEEESDGTANVEALGDFFAFGPLGVVRVTLWL
jgi:hypothetical protein